MSSAPLEYPLTQVEPFDLEAIREQFPVLREQINGHQLVYLDNAASAQKPWRMIEETTRFLSHDFSNVHRGVHKLSQRATDQFEAVRNKVQTVLNAASPDEILFTKGCTEGLNLIAQCWAEERLKPGDEILVSHMEHHSNLVPWHLAAKKTGAIVRGIPVNAYGEIEFEKYKAMLSERTKIMAIVHVSNAIGTINPVKEMIAGARKFGALCVVDGAQAGPHLPIDVQDIDADFYTLSCHKMYAPTGIGILYGKMKHLESMPPYQGGGSMIERVEIDSSTYAKPPAKFEPGTPNIVGFIGYGASLDFLASLGGVGASWDRAQWVRAMNRIASHEHELLAHAARQFENIECVRVFGNAKNKAAILCFDVEGVHPHDVGQVLDTFGIAVRVGHHCCQPLMKQFGLVSTTRASFGLYNTLSEVDRLADAVSKVRGMFA